MMTPYAAGYYAARLGIPSWMNPYHPLLWGNQRTVWAMGHDDAHQDAKPRPVVRLQAEFDVR